MSEAKAVSNSLLGSIFGSPKDTPDESKDSLFEQSSSLPAKPQHKVKPKPTRKRAVETEEEGENKTSSARKDDQADDSLSSPKKKSKKKNKNKEENNTETTEDNNQDSKEESKDSDKNNKNDDNAADRTIFVGNLPRSTTRRSLASIFKPCGKVESTRLRSIATAGVKLPPEHAGNQNMVKKVCANTNQLDDESPKTTAQGYVVFESVEAVAKALELNNTTIKDKETKSELRLRVDYSNPNSSSSTQDASRSVFVGNLPYRTDETSLRQHFVDGCGLESPDNIENVRIVRDSQTMQCKGFGYILFQDKSMVSTALKQMHQSTYMKRTIRVMVCGKRWKGKRGVVDESSSSSSSLQSRGRSFEGRRVTQGLTPTGAAKRISNKQQQRFSGGGANRTGTTKKHRARGDTKKNKDKVAAKTGMSKRAVSEAKTNKRIKKIEKRIKKGMGKTKV
mmetsp:Transcript_19242/g.29641  ORF Transcript_19242/g.29641 Transcript_19242/m.29641 type:complete len:450 (+) Transcript_19242:155-1504(+)|eukprot:CAMPEP_0195282782 /NCGR_PEP_ID=MMETSP0707-20130614/1542_1 /TAXON_ID=33640 /ORGANISM="Asterionellopsis glacialis, Strain CCMP134" /LENGTH=449 /DNA_ID=CAMNT_0040341825 /DNA_START=96 /DNA_END=1445 /DNA_ORIENTATION=+